MAPDNTDTLWIASEGNDPGTRPNQLVQVDTAGAILNKIGLPAEIEACRLASSNTGNLDNGFEGVAVLPMQNGRYQLLVAQQLPWDYTTPECEDLDDEPGYTRIWIYDPVAMTWDFVPYELAPVPANASWVGLSEITRVGDGSYVLIEHDNRTGDFAALKTLIRVSLADATDGITAEEKTVYDLIPDLKATHGWITDKPEGVAINRHGEVFVVTDNDGVGDWSGETWFLKLGNVDDLFEFEGGDEDENEDGEN
nr:esterase-like activity of phytase family protein [Nitrosococcus halophilus]